MSSIYLVPFQQYCNSYELFSKGYIQDGVLLSSINSSLRTLERQNLHTYPTL